MIPFFLISHLLPANIWYSLPYCYCYLVKKEGLTRWLNMLCLEEPLRRRKLRPLLFRDSSPMQDFPPGLEFMRRKVSLSGAKLTVNDTLCNNCGIGLIRSFPLFAKFSSVVKTRIIFSIFGRTTKTGKGKAKGRILSG